MAEPERLIVTLDGPAGSGKSTVARKLAQRLGVDFLDTGAMYRGLAAKAILRGIDPKTEDYAVVELARNRPMCFDWATDPPELYVGEQNVTSRLRDQDVTEAVSDIAALSAVRQVMVEAQRRIGQEHPRLVTEGRDQGSVVFTQAECKFFLTASAEVRAQRRADQLRDAGRSVSVALLIQQMRERDHKDSTRKDGPLRCPDDAETIDTSGMSLDGVVDLLEDKIRLKTGSDAPVRSA